MPYDPDLDPILDGISAQLATIVARLDGLEAASRPLPEQPEPETEAPAPVEPPPVEQPPVIELPPVAPPPPVAAEPIWNVLKRSQLSIPTEITVPAGQREIYIPVTADHTDRESFYCYVRGLSNVERGGINVGGMTQQKADFEWGEVYCWSPGDDLTHYVKVVTKATYAAGKSFTVQIAVKGLGDSNKGRGVKVTFADDAKHPDMPPQFHRPLRCLDLSGAQRKNRFDPATLAHADSGFDKVGKPVWRSRLSHGYSQDGNGETGLYMNEEKFPGKAQSPISYDAAEKAVRLHTLAFPMDARPEFESRLFRH